MTIKTENLNIKNIDKFRKKQKLQQKRRKLLTEKNEVKSKPDRKDDIADNNEEWKLDMHTKGKEQLILFIICWLLNIF